MANSIKKGFIHCAFFAMKQSWLKGLAMRFLERSPVLRYQLRQLVHTGQLPSLKRTKTELSPRASKVFHDIQQAMEKH
ncbi:hypothetical protein S7335_4524 [Synechococcus sp. PCC 7335]|uniref:hypothetical protein n=1 Tax=Synechococcus sp. (strain ATCC 29403 / PCC 7335) TaxID=91464 RepID=UPI00017ED283|nr:hypothetical protein [Synechococcus sp. PCC 7335]EDX86817.1 hypothetical protein S7335_4524 [Synechococcus sp. PCC 7335]